MRSRWKWIALALLLCVVALHVSEVAQLELTRAVEAERHADLDGAIIHYRRAASWYVPWLQAPATARDALRRIARDAAVQTPPLPALELQARRALWSALHASRVLMVTGRERQQLAQRIATLAVQTAPPAVGDGRPLERRVAAMTQELLAQTRPQPFGLLCAVFGLVCWVSAVFLFAARGLDAEQALTSTARPLGTAFVLGFGMFVLGLALA